MSTGFPDYLGGFQQPSPYFVSANDKLRCSVASGTTGETITVSYRLWLDNRQIYNGQFTISPANDRSISTHDEPMQNGFLLSVSCKAALSGQRGDTFVRLWLTNATFGLTQPALMLFSDYVTTQQAGGYPNGRVLSPLEGPGGLTEIHPANPGAGLDWSFTVPTNALNVVEAIYFVFATSAAAGNRSPLIRVLDSFGGVCFRTGSTAPIGPGANLAFSSGPGCGFVGDTSFTQQLAMPTPITMRGGDVIGSTTPGINLADQYSAVGLRLRYWLENV